MVVVGLVGELLLGLEEGIAGTVPAREIGIKAEKHARMPSKTGIGRDFGLLAVGPGPTGFSDCPVSPSQKHLQPARPAAKGRERHIGKKKPNTSRTPRAIRANLIHRRDPAALCLHNKPWPVLRTHFRHSRKAICRAMNFLRR
jgi:hypothetical protein